MQNLLESFNVWIILVLAVTVEALVEYTKTIISHEEKKTIAIQMAAMAASIVLCLLAGADLYAYLGVVFGGVPWVGCVLTGIFASRGANFVSDLIGRVRSPGIIGIAEEIEIE